MEDPVDDRKHQSKEKCRPETGDKKPGHQVGNEKHKKRIDDEREEPEREDGYRQGEDEEDRTDEEIERAEDHGGNKSTEERDRDTRNKIRCDEDADRRDKPLEYEFHMQALYQMHDDVEDKRTEERHDCRERTGVPMVAFGDKVAR